MPSKPKPHNDEHGYVCSKRAASTRGFVVVYRSERGYTVECKDHRCSAHTLRGDPGGAEKTARGYMKTPAEFCTGCAHGLPAAPTEISGDDGEEG